MNAAPDAIDVVAAAAGIDLAAYRTDHVEERLQRAFVREEVGDTAALARRLRADPAARERFRRSIAVSVSGLFRDPEQFELLEAEVLPALIAQGRRLSVWSAGCADGTELYSVALVLERLGALAGTLLLGSDVLEENLAVARRGGAIDPDVARRIGPRLHFEQRNLATDGLPAGKWSLILCRNVAIYLAPEPRAQLHRALVGSLAAGGMLMLGRSERLARPDALGLERTWPHVYRRASAAVAA